MNSTLTLPVRLMGTTSFSTNTGPLLSASGTKCKFYSDSTASLEVDMDSSQSNPVLPLSEWPATVGLSANDTFVTDLKAVCTGAVLQVPCPVVTCHLLQYPRSSFVCGSGMAALPYKLSSMLSLSTLCTMQMFTQTTTGGDTGGAGSNRTSARLVTAIAVPILGLLLLLGSLAYVLRRRKVKKVILSGSASQSPAHGLVRLHWDVLHTCVCLTETSTFFYIPNEHICCISTAIYWQAKLQSLPLLYFCEAIPPCTVQITSAVLNVAGKC